MDWQEKYLDKLDRDISEMKNVVQASEDRIARMIENALTEMRDRDNQRHQEIIEIRTRLDEQTKYVRQISLATIGAIAALVISVLVAILTK